MKSLQIKKVLIVEDEINIAKVIEDHFIAAGFVTHVEHNGKKGLECFKTFEPSIIILDIMLPEIDGFSICKRIRKESMVPIIMLTARTDVEDQLFGYELMVDDYINKPFNPEILVAKAINIIERQMRLKEAHDKKDQVSYDDENYFEMNGISINLLSREVYVDNELIRLENKQFDLLKYFFMNPNIVLTRDMLMDKIWGYDYIGNTRAVDAQVTKLRQKLKHKAYCIKTEFGVGYKFENKSNQKHRD